MTGYGSSKYQDESYQIFIEIKSVNHRFCEVNFKGTKDFMSLEIPIKNLIKSKLIRGKIDVNIIIERLKTDVYDVIVDNDLLMMYSKSISNSLSMNKFDNSILKSEILYMLPDVITTKKEKNTDDFLYDNILNILKDAIEFLDNTRKIEGKNLIEDISTKLDKIEQLVENIADNETYYVEDYKKRMLKNFDIIIEKTSLSEDRLAIEAGILLDKLSIDEEITRLKSHISQARRIISNDDDEVGRRFDFLLQEFNREVNTILSKSADTNIINYGVELKTLIEKIREQVQNLV